MYIPFFKVSMCLFLGPLQNYEIIIKEKTLQHCYLSHTTQAHAPSVSSARTIVFTVALLYHLSKFFNVDLLKEGICLTMIFKQLLVVL